MTPTKNERLVAIQPKHLKLMKSHLSAYLDLLCEQAEEGEKVKEINELGFLDYVIEILLRVDHLERMKTVKSQDDPIKHPAHYTDHPSGIEPIEICAHETFYRGNIIKYIMRAPYKGCELQDLKKARQYLDWEIDRIEAGQS